MHQTNLNKMSKLSAKQLITFAITWMLPLIGIHAIEPSEVNTPTSNKITIQFSDGILSVKIGDALFTQYHFQNTTPKYFPHQNATIPCFYPLFGPDNLPMTRNFPFQKHAEESQDHPHHRSLWFAHGSVNGHDFWHTGGKISHTGFSKIRSGENSAEFISHNDWIASNQETICRSTTHVIFRVEDKGARIIDFLITWKASHGDLTLGDTKEGTLAMRVNASMRVKPMKDNTTSPGHILNSEGIQNKNAWGKRARWCTYYGFVNEEIAGAAIFDHPNNPRYPAWWHVREYGLFAANPFGISDFEKKPKGTGDVTIPAGESLSLRYRIILFKGTPNPSEINQAHQQFAALK